MNIHDQLIIAAEDNDVITVQRLILEGADVNYREPNRLSSALIRATFRGFYDVVKCLIVNGANVNTTDSRHMTPLSYATAQDHLNIVKLLIENDATLDYIDIFGGVFVDHVTPDIMIWLLKPKTQKYLIEKDSSMYNILKERDLLRPQIKRQYKHLEVGIDLGLLNN